jgi:hypothetical protein
MNTHKVQYQVKMAEKTTYQVTFNHHSRDSLQALVDRGANGSIVGDDMLVLFYTGVYVDVAGMDEHTVNDLELVTAAGLTDTNAGEHIVIVNQQAFLGKGKSIISSGQMEHYMHHVCEKSKVVGGKQCITTPDGIVIPLKIRFGLPYIDMRVPTKEELE